MESPRVLPEAGDRVRFEFDGNLISGTVFVVDPRGGGVCFGICPSCDVRADDGTLHKHVPINEVEPLLRRMLDLGGKWAADACCQAVWGDFALRTGS